MVQNVLKIMNVFLDHAVVLMALVPNMERMKFVIPMINVPLERAMGIGLHQQIRGVQQVMENNVIWSQVG